MNREEILASALRRINGMSTEIGHNTYEDYAILIGKVARGALDGVHWSIIEEQEHQANYRTTKGVTL